MVEPRSPLAGPRDLGASLRSWLDRTPNRTFVLYPLLVIAGWSLRGPDRRHLDLRFSPLLAWGYLQYRLVGGFRVARGGGGPGIQVPPDRLVESGPYGFVRNPMYLGHLVFLAGLALTFRTRLAVAIFAANAPWFHARVLDDEAQLAKRFGPAYEAYRARVRRWIPGLF